MKTWRLFFLAVIASVFAFSSCSDEEDPITALEPTITLSEGTSVQLDFIGEGKATLNVNFDVTVQAEAKLKNFTVTMIKVKDNEEFGETPVTVTDYADKTDFTYQFNLDFTADDFAGVDALVYEFIATDKIDQVKDARFTITMKNYTLLENLKQGKIYNLMGSGRAAWNLEGDSAMSVSHDKMYKYLINSDNVGSVGTNPSNFTGSWTSSSVEYPTSSGTATVEGNGTLFVKANDFNFNVAYKEKAIEAFDAAGDAATSSVANPEVGDIYIAKKDAEIYVIKITKNDATVAPTKANTGILEFEYRK